MTDFTDLPDLASERLGGAVVWANDEFFAPKENLLREAAAVWKEGEYTDRGKWMDGWETRRHRAPHHDWCLIRLGLPGVVRGVVIDTAFFRGNFPESASIEGCVAAPDVEPQALDGMETGWVELLPKVTLQGDHKNRFEIHVPYRVTHLRFRIHPDGGVARLRVHGEPSPTLPTEGEVDLAGVVAGGRVVAVSDRFFSSPHHLLLPDASRGMHDGWESRRRRGPGHDWAVVRLGVRGEVRRVEIDTSFFRGNFPEAAAIDVADAATGLPEEWVEVVPPRPMLAHTRHPVVLPEPVAATHVRLRILPDGGVARLRVWGVPTPDGLAQARLDALNELVPEEAERAFLKCCGSVRWAAVMAQARPFANRAALDAAVAQAEAALTDEDWLEAFAAHPPIGGSKPGSATARWSASEQAGMNSADAALRAEMADANAAYRERFGYTYIVCATGRSAGEMLALLRARLGNEPSAELAVAAAEQARITRIRLEKLLS